MSADSPASRLRFQWSWRPYQERVLHAVERHLADDRLHIVAAPGAGKTTLGLEVFRRLDRPALVLAPTLTIRDQWLRSLEDFVVDDSREWLESWTSPRLDQPAFFTAVTYQAVLARYRADLAASAPGVEEEPTEGAVAGDDALDEDEAEAPSADDVGALVETLRRARVGTLILDEAHHLKRAWWTALESVADAISDLTLVSLTGTPPYDATGTEWRRYEELCGPIDAEISAPELVKAGTLCPHQDFVYAVTAEASETAATRHHDDAVRELTTSLLEDAVFQSEVDSHPWVSDDGRAVEEVLEEPEVAVALLAYLRATAAGLPPGLLGALGLSADELPALTPRWWQVLTREYLFGSSFSADPEYRRSLVARLRSNGLLYRRSLRIDGSGPTERALSLSRAKVGGCVAIHELERSVRGDALRQVILTDYIRAARLDSDLGAALPDLGAVPVFDGLLDAGLRSEDVGLVTGRVSILHESRVADVRLHLGEGIALTTSPLPGRSGWVRVGGMNSGALVAAFTHLLSSGRLRVLVGTRSLLGEGWDAPVVNSVVLASFVGATVSTNQMRGRAIRAHADEPGKVASVWHIVAVAPETPSGFLDLAALEARFRTFVGLSSDGTSIESGIERLALPACSGTASVDALNRENARRLENLDAVARGWTDAIASGTTGQVVPTARLRSPPTLRQHYVARTLRYALIELSLASGVAAAEIARRSMYGGVSRPWAWVALALVIPMAALLPKLARGFRLAFRHLPIDGSAKAIGRAVLEALVATRQIEEVEDVHVQTSVTAKGVSVALVGGSFRDQSLFADAIGEVLGPVENPRYLITRRRSRLFGGTLDYHAVPHVLGTRKRRAKAFLAAWRRYVGEGELMYTRRPGGREALLTARGRAFSNQFSDPVERLDRWQ